MSTTDDSHARKAILALVQANRIRDAVLTAAVARIADIETRLECIDLINEAKAADADAERQAGMIDRSRGRKQKPEEPSGG